MSERDLPEKPVRPAPVDPPGDPETREEGEGVRILLPVFEGPLDLLLHLIRSNQMDIFDIPIVEVARQYGEYLELMKEMNLRIAGEFLLMAATLAHIKSRMLLPQEPAEDGESLEDPRADLTRQLIEHERFRLAAENLQAMEAVQGLVWARPSRSFPELDVEPELVVDLYSLMSAFKRLMDQLAANERLRFTGERFSVSDKIDWLTALMDKEGSLPFLELMAPMTSRAEMIATFLALLELIRRRVASARQKTALGEIWIVREAPAGETGAATSSPTPGPVREPREKGHEE